MMNMEEQKESFFSAAQQDVASYVNARLLLMKLQAAEKSSKVIALLTSVLIIGLLGFFVLLFVSIMLGYFFAEKTGSLFYGFGIVTGIYILLLVVLLALRKNKLEKFVANSMVKVLFDNSNDEDDDEVQTP
jgi:Putative Actinobacterial Holin-X, holin superfamily III